MTEIPAEFWLGVGGIIVTVLGGIGTILKWLAGFLTRQQEVITNHIKATNKTMVEVRDDNRELRRELREDNQELRKEIAKLADCIKDHSCGG